MRMLTFARRNFKEIIRDPLNLGFGLGFPLVVILLLSAIQENIPVPLFEIAHLTPGVTVFGLSFMTLFSATLLATNINALRYFYKRRYDLNIRIYLAYIFDKTFLRVFFSHILILLNE